MRRRNQEDLAKLLLRKASDDEAVVRELLSNRNVSDLVIGFHAQQAAEKLLKSVLAAQKVRYGRTHNIARLIQLVTEAGVPVPDSLHAASALTPFGAELRYEELSTSEEPLDRAATHAIIGRLRSWAEEVIQGMDR